MILSTLAGGSEREMGLEKKGREFAPCLPEGLGQPCTNSRV